jgi:hypothetical protein
MQPLNKMKNTCKTCIASLFLRYNIARTKKDSFNIFRKNWKLEICVLLAKTKELRTFSQQMQLENIWLTVDIFT